MELVQVRKSELSALEALDTSVSHALARSSSPPSKIFANRASGIMGAKALGCEEIVAISRSSTKKTDAMKMGATKFIATDEDKDWASKNAGTLDIIVSTVSSPKMPFSDYLGLLRLRGQYVQVGAPEDVIPAFNSKHIR